MNVWNTAAIWKQLWAITEEKECLWIKWVHIYYMKGLNAEYCPIPKNASWVIRRILIARQCVMENQLLRGDLKTRLNMMVVNGKFSIKKMYLCLTPQLQKVYWKNIVTLPTIHPRHKFFIWLAAWKRLATVDSNKEIIGKIAYMDGNTKTNW
ncbi:hypothetical protein KY284_000415 [Solanum tuberosum]|nr:hypothetical protein KY284_000415 [Solanum tuberosum]